jgi:type I restriction enzyme M protein
VVKLEEVCTVSCGDTAPQENDLFINGKYPFYRTSDVGFVHLSDNLLNVRDRLNDDGIRGLKLFPKGTILFPKSGASTFLNHRVIMGEDGYVSSHLATIVVDKSKVNEKYLYYLLTKINAKDITPYQAYPSLKISVIRQIKIPLPPLAIQEQIVTEIEEQQKMINKYKKSIEKINNKIESKISYILENKKDKLDEYVKTLPVSDEELNNEVKQALLDDGEDFIPESDFELNDEFETSLKDELSDF